MKIIKWLFFETLGCVRWMDWMSKSPVLANEHGLKLDVYPPTKCRSFKLCLVQSFYFVS